MKWLLLSDWLIMLTVRVALIDLGFGLGLVLSSNQWSLRSDWTIRLNVGVALGALIGRGLGLGLVLFVYPMVASVWLAH